MAKITNLTINIKYSKLVEKSQICNLIKFLCTLHLFPLFCYKGFFFLFYQIFAKFVCTPSPGFIRLSFPSTISGIHTLPKSEQKSLACQKFYKIVNIKLLLLPLAKCMVVSVDKLEAKPNH